MLLDTNLARVDNDIPVIPFKKIVRYKFTDQVRGEMDEPVFVVPAATVMTAPNILLFQKDQVAEKKAYLQVNANRNLYGYATITERSPVYNKSYLDSLFALKKDNSLTYSFLVNSDKLSRFTTAEMFGLFNCLQNSDTISGYLSMRSINYNHIPSIRYFYADPVKLLNLDLKTYNKKIGYIIGAGDKVPEALEEMGYDVVLLTEKELARNNLQQYDAIITGVRAFNTNGWMSKYYDKLMDYVQNGGNYIVQYSQANSLRGGKMGPYDFALSNKRITDENAPVTFLNPDHPVLNFPNKITQEDFKGWIQERSIYHADRLDSNFQTILRMNDPGEAPDDGALVIAKYGKGYFTYTGLVFFRELPAGVPGAYRLISNIIALNRKKEF